MSVRFFLIASADYPLRDDNTAKVRRGIRAVDDYFKRWTGRRLDREGDLILVQSETLNADAWRDPFRFSHECAAQVGYSAWDEENANFFVWQGGGGYAGGFTIARPDGSYRVGWAMIGDWSLDGAYDVENRPDWVRLDEPATFGGWAHELGHALAIRHVDEPDNISTLGYLQFPDCTMTAGQVADVLGTGQFQPVTLGFSKQRMDSIVAAIRAGYGERGWEWPS